MKFFSKFLFLGLLLGIFVISCEDNTLTPPVESFFESSITDNNDAPITNINVDLIQVVENTDNIVFSTKSDSLGLIKVKYDPSNVDNLILKVTHPSFQPFREKLANLIENKKNNPLGKSIIKLMQNDTCCGLINVVVKDDSTQTVIKNAEIKLSVNDQLKRKVYTDENGKAALTNLCPAKYWIRIAYEGYKVIEEDIVIEKCDTLNKVFGLKKLPKQDTCCNNSATINVKNAEGDLLDSVVVKLWYGGSLKYEKLTSNGKVKFENLCTGKYSGTLSKSTYKPIEFSFEVGCDKNLTYDKVLYKQEENNCCGIIKVKIIDSQTKSVIPNVEVKLTKSGQVLSIYKTNEDGYVLFTKICKGSYGLRMAKDGYTVLEKSVTTNTDCDSVVVTHELVKQQGGDTCCKGVIKVYPKDSQSGAILNGARVRMWSNGQLLKTVYVENNVAVINNVCPGTYGFDVMKEGYNGIEFEQKAECNQTYEITKTMSLNSCCGIISVKLIDSKSKNPVQNADVKLVKNGQYVVVKTGDNGVALFTKICKGEYSIRAFKTGYTTLEKSTSTQTDCDSLYLTYEFVPVQEDTCCNAIIKVTAKDSENGLVLNGATVKMWKGGQLIKTLTIENGYAKFTNVCVGTYSFSINKEGYTGIEFSQVVECNKTYEITKTMSSNSCCGIISVKVVDSKTNLVVPNAEVKLSKNGQYVVVKTNESGIALFTKVCQGDYGIRIAKTGYNVLEKTTKTVTNCDSVYLTYEFVPVQEDTCCDNNAVFTIKDAEGNLLTGINIKIKKNGQIVKELVTQQGTASYNNVCTGVYSYLIYKDGYVSQDGQFTVTCKTNENISKVLQKSACCTAKLKIMPKDSANGEAINGATVKVWKGGQLIKTGTVENGYVLFEGLCEGVTYGISINHDLYKGLEFNTTVSCSEVTTYTKYLLKK